MAELDEIAWLVSSSSFMHWFGLNWWDITLGTGVLAIVPFWLAAYGGHVAAEPIEDARRRRNIKLKFWGIAFLGVVAAFIQQYRAAVADQARDTRDDWMRVVSIRQYPSPLPPSFSVHKFLDNGQPDLDWLRQTHDPSILITAMDGKDWIVKTKQRGIFEFLLQNIGSADIYNIDIFDDYFTAESVNPLRLRPIGAVFAGVADVSLPNVLKAGHKEKFAVNFVQRLKLFEQTRPNWPKPENKMVVNYMRMFVRFRRHVDGKEFYVTNGHEILRDENMMWNLDNRRGIEVMPPEIYPSQLEVKKAFDSLAPH